MNSDILIDILVSGLPMQAQSSSNILDIADQECPNNGINNSITEGNGGEVIGASPLQVLAVAQPTSEVAHADGTGVVANRKPSTNNNSDTHLLMKNTTTYGGEAVSPASPFNHFTENILRFMDEHGYPEKGKLTCV